MPAPPPQADTHARLAALDGLRFLAALLVVVFHTFSTSAMREFWGVPAMEVYGSAVFEVASYGWVGVPLFFMISGFVICMSSWGRTPGQFGISRFVRLYPAYWFAVLLTTAVAVLYPHPSPAARWRHVLTNLTMLQEPLGVPNVDDVYWTLWVELRFYLLFTLVIWRGLTYQRVVAFCLAWGILSAWAPQLGLPWLREILIDDQAQYFIAGVACYLVYRFGSHLVLWLIVALSWFMSMHYYEGNVWQQINGLSYVPASAAITLFYAILGLLALHRLDWLRWRGLTVLGATTYPLYLLHDVNGLAAQHYLSGRVTLPRWALSTIIVVVLVVVAWLVHRLIERPLAPRLKRALSRGVDAAGRGARRQAGRHAAPEPPSATAERVPRVVEVLREGQVGRAGAAGGLDHGRILAAEHAEELR